MSDSSVRCWLVERDVDERDLVRTIYATRDGRRFHRRERSATSLGRSPVTAAISVPKKDLEETSDDETRERYAREAERVAEQYEPDEPI